MTIRLLIADDREIVRLGLRAMLDGSEFHLVAAVSCGTEAQRTLRERQADLLVMREQLCQIEATDVLAEIRRQWPELPIVLLGRATANRSGQDAAGDRAPQIIARIDEHDSQPTLFGALYAALGREAPSAATRAVRSPHAPLSSDVATVLLTQREREVLRQLVHGRTNKEIAETLGIGPETVKEHVRHLLRKLDVSDRTQAAVWAVRQGLG